MFIRYFRSACSYGTDGFIDIPKPHPFIKYNLQANIFKNIFIDISLLINKFKNIFSYLVKGNDFSFGRDLKKDYPEIVKGKGIYLYTKNNRIILDGSCGAAVSCIGHGDNRVTTAINKILNQGTTYLSTTF